LFLIRHGESEWNALGKWTGTTDVHLTEKGFREAAMFGQKLQNEKIDFAFTSEQIRALETLEGIMDASQQFDIPFERTSAFNERDYGDYTGKNKWEMKEILGEDAFNHLRRDWDYPVPGGETLKQVFERAVPFYKDKVMPLINYGKNVLIVSHGNSMRALMKYIEKIDDKEISNLEMPFGNIIMYQVDKDGYATKKAIRTIDTTPPKA
jgi:2,3-bisphosphoglycerate-dependent phosphoglycerate mutase